MCSHNKVSYLRFVKLLESHDRRAWASSHTTYYIDMYIYNRVSCLNVSDVFVHARDESGRVRACESGAMECEPFRLWLGTFAKKKHSCHSALPKTRISRNTWNKTETTTLEVLLLITDKEITRHNPLREPQLPLVLLQIKPHPRSIPNFLSPPFGHILVHIQSRRLLVQEEAVPVRWTGWWRRRTDVVRDKGICWWSW